MPSMLAFAQMDTFRMRPESLLTYVALTVIFLFLMWLTDARSRPLGATLIIWGILVAVLASGYAILGDPAVVVAIPNLMKIGFLLVLGGLAWCVLTPASGPLNPVPNPPSTNTREGSHV